MKTRLAFYSFLSFLVILDSLLLSHPNLVGKIGLIIYRYNYLRSFPKTLLTVTIVMLIAVLLCECIIFLAHRQVLGRRASNVILLFLVVVSVGIFVKTGLDFATLTYGHTGLRFRYGTYLLLSILMLIFIHGLVKLPKRAIPLLPVTDDLPIDADVDH